MRPTAYFIFFCFVAYPLFLLSSDNVELLNKKAEALLNQNPREALNVAAQALNEARNVKDKKGEIRAITLSGVASYKVDDYKQSRTQVGKSIELATTASDTSELAFATYWLGNLDLVEGQYSDALNSYQAVLQLATATGDKKNLARAYDGTASIYEALGSWELALSDYQRSLEVAREADFKEWYPGVNFSIANIALSKGQTEKAIEQFEISLKESEAVGNINNKGNCLQQLASIYNSKGDTKKAMTLIQEAMNIFEETGSKSSYSYSRLLMSNILIKDREYDLAIEFARKSLEEGRSNKEPQLQKNAAEMLYYAFNAKDDKSSALDYHILFHQLSEKERDQNMSRQLAKLELQSNFESERKVAEAQRKAKEAELNAHIENQEMVKKTSIIGIGLFSIIALMAIFAFLQKQKDNRAIAAEKMKSDEVLMNVLPAEIALEIKENRQSDSANHNMATVMFADLKNAAGAADKQSHQSLKEEAANIFKMFDSILVKHNVERVRTVEDAYICLGKMAGSEAEGASSVIGAALEIKEYIEKLKLQNPKDTPISYDIRIGVHTGSLVAGIVGLRKYSHDVWGDTINVAARMEQHGDIGQINISGATQELVKKKFKCSYRGKVEEKNKGEVEMYFVEGVL